MNLLIRRDRAEWLLLLFLIAIFVWRGLVPGWRSLNTDFPNYYLMAKLYHQGYPLERQYEWTWFQRQKDHAGIEQPLVSAIPLTPLSALPLLPFSTLSPLLAKRLWLVLTLILLLATGHLLDHLTALGRRRVAILMFLAIEPLRANFVTGQLHVLVLLLLTIAAYFYFKGHGAGSGAVLALAGGLKIYPFLFLVYFVRKKAWRAAAALAAGCATVSLLSIWLFGIETVRVYALHVLPRAMAGESNNPYSIGWNSFTALLRRLFVFEPELNPHPLVHSIGAYAALQPLCQALLVLPFLWLVRNGRTDGQRERLEWGSFVAVLLLLSTNPASYQYCVLMLTAVLCVDALRGAGRRPEAMQLVFLYAIFCAWPSRLAPQHPSGWRALLGFPSLYVMTALLGLLLWVLWTPGNSRLGLRVRVDHGVIFASLFLGLAGLGTVSNLHDLKGQVVNYRARLFIRPGALMARDPSVTSRITLDNRGHSCPLLPFPSPPKEREVKVRDVFRPLVPQLIERGGGGEGASNDYVGQVNGIGRDRLSFTNLGAKSYTVGLYTGKRLDYFSAGTDVLHPAMLPRSDVVWAEFASTTSQIARLPDVGWVHDGLSISVEVQDGEQPVISADGRLLAFIREKAGRGGLWVEKLAQDQLSVAGDSLEMELAGEDYDVCDLAFLPDDRVVFAAEPHGAPTLFIADPASRLVRPLPYSGPWERYPAVSPDGRWLVYSRQESGNWHLWVRELNSSAGRRLTSGACNSVTPAWLSDSHTLVYATDCGRGLGLTALCLTRATP